MRGGDLDFMQFKHYCTQNNFAIASQNVLGFNLCKKTIGFDPPNPQPLNINNRCSANTCHHHCTVSVEAKCQQCFIAVAAYISSLCIKSHIDIVLNDIYE